MKLKTADGPNVAQSGNQGEGKDQEDDIAKKEGTTRDRTAVDRQRWKALAEGGILQWMGND